MKNIVHTLILFLFLNPTSVAAKEFEIVDMNADVFSKIADGQEIWDFLANFTVSDGIYSGGIKINGHGVVHSNGHVQFKTNDFCPEDTPGQPQVCFFINNITKYNVPAEREKHQNYFLEQPPEKLAQLEWFCGLMATRYDELLGRLSDFASDPENIEDQELAPQLPEFFRTKQSEYEVLGVRCLDTIKALSTPQQEPVETVSSDDDTTELRQELAQLKSDLRQSNQMISTLAGKLDKAIDQLEAKQADLDQLQRLVMAFETPTKDNDQNAPDVDQRISELYTLLAAQDAKMLSVAQSYDRNAAEISKLEAQIEQLSTAMDRMADDLLAGSESVQSAGSTSNSNEELRQSIRDLGREISDLKAQLQTVQNASPAPQMQPEATEFSVYLDGELDFEIIDDDRSFAQVKDLQDDPVALWHLGALYARGNGVAQDYEKGIAALVKSSELGYALSQNELGTLYHNGTYFERDFAQAFYWYDLAAKQGYGQAIVNIAGMYAVGQHKPRNIEKSIQLREIALEKGHAPSALRLGEEYFYGNPVYPPDCRKGKEYLIRAVELGVPDAGKKLIKAYSHAVGTRAISPCAGDMGATMEGLDEVKKFVIFNGYVELNPRLLSSYYGLGFKPLNENRGGSQDRKLFENYSHDEILEMLVFLFAEIEHVRQLGGDYTFDTGQLSTTLRAKILLNGLVLKNCGWIDNPLIDRRILDMFDFAAILGKSDFKSYQPDLTDDMRGFCKRVTRLLDQRIALSEARNHEDYYGYLEPREILEHLKEYTSEPEL